MAARTPDVTRAAIEFGFIVIAFLCGLLGAPMWMTGLAGIAQIAYWSWSRRASLSRLSGSQRIIQSVIAIALIIAVFAFAYWLGFTLTGGQS
jgi:hypothetical protein